MCVLFRLWTVGLLCQCVDCGVFSLSQAAPSSVTPRAIVVVAVARSEGISSWAASTIAASVRRAVNDVAGS